MRFRFATDTATFCVFDLAAMRHRIEDDSDWWTLPDAELEELNKGNVAFIGLREDGAYDVELVDLLEGADDCSVNLYCPSGRIFLGAGEEVTSNGLEPDGTRGGVFVAVSQGWYRISAKRTSAREIAVSIRATSAADGNQFQRAIRI